MPAGPLSGTASLNRLFFVPVARLRRKTRETGFGINLKARGFRALFACPRRRLPL